ncbi:LAS seventeen-binding protein 3 [Pseudocercospora fuligena]|uniref:LAS seventeen-binding protein 3 n=1 Tax=Pseudocercospora fuligena TaxID=685502 RepID=A0A8H6RR18_9PEZI|nr:LAS seventeen-binding protein 3 [Pseudocercospora fuligena]
MKAVQRMGGKMMKRSADQQDVGAVLGEFKSTDDMLDRLEKELKAWRNGWDDILKLQYDASEAFATLYKPIEPTSYPEQRNAPAATPQGQLQKCLALQKMYSETKTDLQQEISMIDNKLLRPVHEAKAATKPLHKTLKHRENMKLDYERYMSRAEHARKKQNRTIKEESALAKCETDLQQAQLDYETADDQVKQTFPPVIEAVQALLPHILAIQIQVQTTLVGQLYTTLDAYCRQQHLPSPAPSNDQINAAFDQQFTSFRMEVESGLTVIAQGKAVKMPMDLPDKQGSSYTGLGIRNKAGSAYDSSKNLVTRNKNGQPGSRPAPPAVPGATNGAANGRISSPAITPAEEEAPPPKPPRPSASPAASYTPGYPSPAVSPGPRVPFGMKPRVPSYTGNNNAAPYDHKGGLPMPSFPNQPPPAYSESQVSTPPSHYVTPPNGLSPRPGSVKAGADYFGGMPPLDRKQSAASVASSVASVAAKKKPRPPVPVKRIASNQGTYVTALYDFEGQTAEDLPFREGDKIKVLKKTQSTDDWWDGELNGRRGQFPANYVQL